MLLILGALVLFSLMLPSLNETVLYNDTTLIATNAELTAIALAEKLLAEASTLAFDLYCLTTNITSPSQLTPAFSLGPAWGETYPNFNDLDDFNGLTLQDSTTFPSVLFNISCTVTYADTADPSLNVSTQTFLKRLLVNVTSPYLINPASGQSVTITMQQVFAYYGL
jgi:hypothetical protein